MASPHLAAPALSAQATSPLASPAGSAATGGTFGAGGHSNRSPNAAGPRHGQDSLSSEQGRRGPSPRTSNARPSPGGARPSAASAGPTHIIEGPGGRILCVADVRGNLSSLNRLAAETDAQAIIHTGDFGFYEAASFERISDRTLRHVVQYTTLIPPALRAQLLSADVPGGARSASGAGGVSPAAQPPPMTTSCKEMRAQILAHSNSPLLTEFPALLSGQLKFNVPVYTVWGACEDVRILEKIRTQEYAIPNLHVLDEVSTVAIEVGGLRLRLFGLGGAVVLHKLFDNGEGAATIAGGQGTMWTTILQIGELVDTAQKSYDPSETRLLVTHASPGREGLLMQLALALKADLTISAGLHFRYGVSYNEFSVQSDTEQFRRKLLQSKSAFGEVWESVRSQVEDVVDDQQRILLNNGLAVTNRAPNAATATGAVNEEPAWKNTWNWNLPDAAYGHLVLDISEGRVSSEMKSQGFNYAYRRAEAGNNSAPNAPPPTSSPLAGIAANRGPPAVPAASAAIASASPAPLPAAIPTGPAKMLHGRDQSKSGEGRFPASKSPRGQHRPSGASGDGGSISDTGAAESRPASSKSNKHGPHGGSRSGDEVNLPRGPRRSEGEGVAPRGPKREQNNSISSTQNGKGLEKEVSPPAANGAAGAATESQIPPSFSNQSIKSNDRKSHKSTRGKKGSAFSSAGYSSKSEKSASDTEGRYAHKDGTNAPPFKQRQVSDVSGAPAATSAPAGGEDGGKGETGNAEGGAGSTAGRGGASGRGRGGNRGGRGGRGGGPGGRGGGPGQSQERRKSNTGGPGGEGKGAPSGGNEGAKAAPAS